DGWGRRSLPRRNALRLGTRMSGRPIWAAIVVTFHAQRCIPAPPERNAVLRAATSPRLPPRTYGRRVASILLIRSSTTRLPKKGGKTNKRCGGLKWIRVPKLLGFLSSSVTRLAPINGE